jgi:hypothetical protein
MVRRKLQCASALVAGLLSSAAIASIGSTSTDAANKLIVNQAGNGSWSGETQFSGPIVAGLTDAYNYFGVTNYKTAAQSGANYILTNGPNYLGDETFALTRVSSFQPNPNANTYRTAVVNYYNSTIPATVGGTDAYLNNFVNHYTTVFGEESQAVIYLSYHTLAAYAVNATEKIKWRNKLVDTLGMIDDGDYYPVGSLGAAMWALAATDNGLSAGTTLVGPSTTLNGKTLSQLPAYLTQHIAPTNAFYYRFDHSGGNGFTEDTAYDIMGLQAAYLSDPTVFNYSGDIANARNALLGSIGNDGTAYLDIFQSAPAYNVYGGRFLQAELPEPSAGLLVGAFGAILLKGRRRK